MAPLAAQAMGTGTARHRKPNILFILLDDLGKEWVRACGSEEDLTPTLDALAADGMEFTNAYSMPQCTPSRATLLTGQYPFRNGWVNHWDVPRWGWGCHFDWKHNTSFGTVMQSAGYATAAAGKWQINDFRVTPDAMERHGFDAYCMWTGYETGTPASAERYWNPYIHTRDGSRTYPDRFGEDVFCDFLIDFMGSNRDKPLFLYYPMCLPHHPFTSTPAEPDVDVNDPAAAHRAMVRYADICLKRLVDALEENGLRDNTLIIWTTDNGACGSQRARLKGRMVTGGKSRLTENGVCAPFIVNCPGRVPAGVKTDALTDFSDLLPTFAELGGASLPDGRAVDGVSIAKVMLGLEPDSGRDWIMAMGADPATVDQDGWVVPATPYRERVIRNKRWKLRVDANRTAGALYDLRNDPGETRNLLHAEDAEALAALEELTRVAASMPVEDAAPKYDRLPAQPWDKRIPESERRIR